MTCAANGVSDPTPASFSVEANPLEEGVGADLNRALRLLRNRSIPTASVVDSIVRLGPGTIDPAILVLDARKLPPIDGGVLQALSDSQEARLLEALRRMDPGLVWNAIDTYLVTEDHRMPPVSARAAAVLAAGTCADPDEIGRVLECARCTKSSEMSPALERAVTVAAEDLYRRNPSGLTHLASCWRRLPAWFLPAMIHGAGAAGDARALPFLEQMLNQQGDLRKLSLAKIALQRAPADVSTDLLEELRSLLDSGSPGVSQAACNAVGALGDFGSVEKLTALLASDSAGLKGNAHHALCTMSGLKLPPQASSWQTWRLHETAWFNEHSRRLADMIAEGSVPQASDALTEIATHRWQRHALSDIAALGLARGEVELVEQACGVLQSLGSPRARIALAKAPARDDPRYTAALSAALAALQTR